jgi:hypothetical protein
LRLALPPGGPRPDFHPQLAGRAHGAMATCLSVLCGFSFVASLHDRVVRTSCFI